MRVGLPKATGSLPLFLEQLDQPALLSAGSLWDTEHQRFHELPMNVDGLDIALDSAGFVAMKQGGYRFDPFTYAALAGSYRFAWWSQMDLCCEPEIAADRAAVHRRITGSAQLLFLCRQAAAYMRTIGDPALTDPMPVLQGWQPDDYARCVDTYAGVLQGAWPQLVGVGSMCRRSLRGGTGVVAVLRVLERVLPRHVGLHLFGVKGDALQALHGNPRIVSVDSMAWDRAARWRAVKEGVPCSMALKKEEIARWLASQQAQGLWGAVRS